ncbi:hypothetical protein IFM89_010169 [Coptis chinensis]|uniref:Benzyl alcohol O-benzoyltransferase n=1 Tax=Coptis chinensis TaxID=261450 RepID=A0A835IBG5_9MAGN|nr:hypothetical protein IFM89_010169 [Coptis chinensis]
MATILKFSIEVGQPVFITPETPTPTGFKYLSNMDDQIGLRNHVPFIHLYRPARNVHTMADPVPIIKLALSRALVLYYPIAVFFSKSDLSSLKNQINGGKCAAFDAVASCLWKARTKTIIDPESETKLIFPIDTRFRYKPLLPNNYFGTAVVFPCATTKASELIQKPLQGFCSEGVLLETDMSRLRFADVDFGWGPAAYAGPLESTAGPVPGLVTPLHQWSRADPGF